MVFTEVVGRLNLALWGFRASLTLMWGNGHIVLGRQSVAKQFIAKS
jgi:hypothetical protein